MALAPEEVAKTAQDMASQLTSSLQKDAFLGKIRRYLKGDHDLPYMPRGATAEYKALAETSITNWLPLVSETFSQGLAVSGYRTPSAEADDAAWAHWQRNGMDARQSVVHLAALEYGAAYVLVRKGDPDPSIKALHPTRVWALYEDQDDDFPVLALIKNGVSAQGSELYTLLEGPNVWDIEKPKGQDNFKVIGEGPIAHGFDKPPLVRFRDRLDGENVGIIKPLMTIQDRINTAVFSLMIAIQYASFRQRWATGLDVPIDPETGKAVEPFKAAVDRLWISDSPDTKFGDFAQTEVAGHISSYEQAVSSLSAIAQTSPHVFLGDLINLSADALAAAEKGTQRKLKRFQTLFGESWELVLKLAAIAAGDPVNEGTETAQVQWADTEARSLAQTVDALGKMVQMLSVPAEGAWEMIPGVTQATIKRWRALGSNDTGLRQLADAISRQTAPPPDPATAEPPAEPPAAA
ncbi:phage portal protein [Kribbella sp. NBC_01505]|uniref:phage portal protein n=1 Tax=Kribbella sp. NBC_01505 TaxID=2903580 RepID=UPI003866F58F